MSRDLEAMRLAEDAFDLPPHQVAAFLSERCGDDAELRQMVEKLLTATQQASGMLSTRHDTVAEPESGSGANGKLQSSMQPGFIIADRYEIRDIIGRGGMGDVYSALDRRLERTVAIKTLNVTATAADGYSERFRREARIVASLSHPNIVTLFDVIDIDAERVAIMELINGRTLRQVNNESTDWQSAVRYAAGIASALAYAHAKQIMHRDIKPENVIVCDDGRARVLDFGLARTTSVRAEQNLTAAGMMTGTAPYMSPEQAENRELSCATDVFSLGTMLLELLTGEHPFRGNSLLQTLQNVASVAIPLPLNLPNEVPTELTDLVTAMLSRAADDRPSADEVCERLQSILYQNRNADTPSPGLRSPAQTNSVDDDSLLRALSEGISDAVGRQFFRALVKSLAETQGAYCAMVTEFDRKNRKARALAFWTDDGWFEGYEYTIADTPCEAVFETQMLYHHPDHLQGLFPLDHDLPEMGLVSYMGVPLLDHDGTVMGNLAVMDRKPMPREPRCVNVLRLFANRAAAEHRRLKREAELRQREQRLSHLIHEVDDGILEFNEDWKITRCNRSMERLLPQQSGLPGKDLRMILAPQSIGRLQTVLKKPKNKTADESSVSIPNGLILQTSDGNQLAVRADVSRLKTSTGYPVTLILRDRSAAVDSELPATNPRKEAKRLGQQIALARAAEILGECPAMEQLRNAVKLIAATETSVLISGETGTGKDLVARSIHAASARREFPFVTLNCASITPDQLDAALYDEPTSAPVATSPPQPDDGRLFRASNGTMLLNDVDRMPFDVQGRLINLLESADLSDADARGRKVRFIAATGNNLREKMTQGLFRQDLFFRLNVFPIELPPLRDRGLDVILLARNFVSEFERTMQRGVRQLPTECEQLLASYPWPGNVRELRNVVERAMLISVDCGLDVAAVMPNAASASLNSLIGGNRRFTESELLELERRNLRQAMNICNDDPQKAAQLLGIAESRITDHSP